MEASDVESGIDHGPEENRNVSPTIRCDTPAPANFGKGVDKEERSYKKFEPAAIPEVEIENEKIDSMVLKHSKADDNAAPPKQLMRFYPGDVVVRKEKYISNFRTWQPSFGTVLKPSVGSEMANNPDKGSSLEFHVHWDASNRVLLTKASEVELIDRVLLRGQRVENHDGKVGNILDYEVSSTVQVNGTNEVIENVPLQRLSPISPYVRGLEIIYQDWVGVIASIKRNVWFRLDGNFTFFVETIENDGFSKTDPYWGMGVACPGMRTRLPVTAYKRATWSSSSFNCLMRFFPLQHLFALMYATVIRSEVTQLEIKWLQRTPASIASDSHNTAPPPTFLKATDLPHIMPIGTPSFETIGINSVRQMKILPEDKAVDFDTWIKEFKQKAVDKKDPVRVPRRPPQVDKELQAMLGPNETEYTPVKVLQRHNVVKVKWEDGVVEKISATELPRIAPTADDGEFPMGLVVAPFQKNSANGDKYGIIMESNELARARSRKVNIRWIVDGRDEGVQESSVFDIRPHPIYSMYHRGTIIFPRTHSSANFESAVVTDIDLSVGKMVTIRANDHRQVEVYPHQVVALGKRCHWSFFIRSWVIDDLVVPPYQLDLEFDPSKKLVDVKEQNLNVLANNDVNNPGENSQIPTLWDEPTFELLGFASESHRYYKSATGDQFAKDFARNVKKEIEFLDGNVPEGVWIRCYENRLDLVSVLMVGPTKTPYDDGLFLFDLQLPSDFPKSRPAIHFVSYTLEIHPLLSFDGNVCVSGIPWEFPNTQELPKSYLGYFLTKLQSMLFTPNPYFAHPSKQVEDNTERGRIKSRMYNQGVYIRVIDTAWNMLQNPHEPWKKCIRSHFFSAMPEKFYQAEKWLNGETSDLSDDEYPSYPLLPIPDGLRCAIISRMELFKKLFNQTETFPQVPTVADSTADSESFEVQTEKPATPDARMLTPIAEITEPSSTSTFGGKLSNLSVPADDTNPSQSLDSMKNVKQKKGFKPESDTEAEDLEMNQAPNEVSAANE